MMVVMLLVRIVVILNLGAINQLLAHVRHTIPAGLDQLLGNYDQ